MPLYAPVMPQHVPSVRAFSRLIEPTYYNEINDFNDLLIKNIVAGIIKPGYLTSYFKLY